MNFSHNLDHSNVVEILLQNGANVNAETTDLWTSMHEAAENGRFSTIYTITI